jgi:hypothetical protein
MDRKSNVEFPTGLRQGEMRPLFFIGFAGGFELVNCRVSLIRRAIFQCVFTIWIERKQQG